MDNKTHNTKKSTMNALPMAALAAVLTGLLLSPAAAATVPCGGSGPLYGQAQDCVAYGSEAAQDAIGQVRSEVDGAVILLGGTVDEQRAEAQAAIDILQVAVENAVNDLQAIVDDAVTQAQDNITSVQETIDEDMATVQRTLATVGTAADTVLGLSSDLLQAGIEDLLALSEFLQAELVRLSELIGNLPGTIQELAEQIVDVVLDTYQAAVAWATCTVIGPDGCSEPFPV